MLQALAPQRPLSLGRLPDTSACVSRGNSDRAPTASSFGIELVDVRDLIASPVDIVPLLILYCFTSSNPTARQVGVYWSRRHWWEGTGGCTLSSSASTVVCYVLGPKERLQSKYRSASSMFQTSNQCRCRPTLNAFLRIVYVCSMALCMHQLY